MMVGRTRWGSNVSAVINYSIKWHCKVGLIKSIRHFVVALQFITSHNIKQQLYYNATSVHHSVCSKNWLRSENGKGTMECGSWMRLSWRLLGGCKANWKGRLKKLAYWQSILIISRTFARGHYWLIVFDWLRCLGSGVTLSSGLVVWGNKKEDSAGYAPCVSCTGIASNNNNNNNGKSL